MTDLEIIHDGLAPRVTKAALVGRSDLAMSMLRVCAAKRGRRLNCGSCEKCLRTIFELHANGLLDRCQTLEHRLEPRQLRWITLANQNQIDHWQTALTVLEGRVGPSELGDAVRDLIERGRRRIRPGHPEDVIYRPAPLPHRLMQKLRRARRG